MASHLMHSILLLSILLLFYASPWANVQVNNYGN